MEKVIPRSAVKDPEYKKMLKTEKHHKHPIIKTHMGQIGWKQDPKVRKMVDDIGINNIWKLFDAMGHSRNSEVVREMYRKMGYSLLGYWEIFYWEVNNPDAADYKPPVQK